jgi:DNA-binding NtrC family response regulator
MREGRLLIVDDEAPLRQLMERYLGRLGYPVDGCGTAREALELFRGSPGEYAAVIADLNLPDMAGEGLLRELLRIYPEVRVLVCSGYPCDVSAVAGPRASQFSFLSKPFVPKMLSQAVADLLGAEADPA